MPPFGSVLPLLLLALPSITGETCYTYNVPTGLYFFEDDQLCCQHFGADDPHEYPDDEEVDPVSYPVNGIDDTFRQLDYEDDDTLEYPDDGEDFNYTHAREVNDIMCVGMMSLGSMYIAISDLSSSGCYMPDTCHGCRVMEWDSGCCMDDNDDEAVVDTADHEEMETSVNLTQYPSNTQIPKTFDITISNMDYNTTESNASCCHGNESSEDDAVMRSSKSCYECRSDPWGACGNEFDPRTESVKEIQCYDGCQKSVHPEFVSRGCLASNHHDGCKKKVCVTELCTHCCIGDLCNTSARDINVSTAALLFNLHVLLFCKYLLQYD